MADSEYVIVFIYNTHTVTHVSAVHDLNSTIKSTHQFSSIEYMDTNTKKRPVKNTNQLFLLITRWMRPMV